MTRNMPELVLLLSSLLLAASCGSGLAAIGLATDSSDGSSDPEFRVTSLSHDGADQDPALTLRINFNRKLNVATIDDDSLKFEVDGVPTILSTFAESWSTVGKGTSLVLELFELMRLDTPYTIVLTNRIEDTKGLKLNGRTETFRVRVGKWDCGKEVISLLVPSDGTTMLSDLRRTTILRGIEGPNDGIFQYKIASLDAGENNGAWADPIIFHTSNTLEDEPNTSGYRLSLATPGGGPADSIGPRLYAFMEGQPVYTPGTNLPHVRARVTTRAFLDASAPDHDAWERDGVEVEKAPLLDEYAPNQPYIPWPGYFGFTETAAEEDVHALGIWWAWTRSDGDFSADEFDEWRIRAVERPFDGEWGAVQDLTPAGAGYCSWPLMALHPEESAPTDGSAATAVWWCAPSKEGVYSEDCVGAPQPQAFWMTRYIPVSGWQNPPQLARDDQGVVLPPNRVHRLSRLEATADGKYLIAAGRATDGPFRDQGPLAWVIDNATGAWSGPFPFDPSKNTRLVKDIIRTPDVGKQDLVRSFTIGTSPRVVPVQDGTVFMTWLSGTPAADPCEVNDARLMISRFDPVGKRWSNTTSLDDKAPDEGISGRALFHDEGGRLTVTWAVKTGSAASQDNLWDVYVRHSTDGGATWQVPTSGPCPTNQDGIVASGGYPICLSGPDLVGDPASGQAMLVWNETNCSTKASVAAFTLTYR